jgi:hypothetical protein
MYRRRVALLRFTVFEILKRTLLMLSQIKKYCRRPLYRWAPHTFTHLCDY